MPATKQKEATEKEVVAPSADVHHVVRRLGTEPRPDGTIEVNQLDAYIRGWLRSGYRLAFVHPLGLEPGGINLLYVLVKD